MSETSFEQSDTNRIARIAGVSIGSLYQYFPGKSALVAALMDRQIERNLKRVEDLIAAQADAPLEKAIDILAREMVEIFLVEASFFRKLFSVAPALGRVETLVKARRRGAELFEQILAKHRDGVDSKDIARLAFICVNAAMGVIQAAGLMEELNLPTRNQLAVEIALLIKSYLRQHLHHDTSKHE